MSLHRRQFGGLGLSDRDGAAVARDQLHDRGNNRDNDTDPDRGAREFDVLLSQQVECADAKHKKRTRLPAAHENMADPVEE